MSNQVARTDNSSYYIQDNHEHIVNSLTRWDDAQTLDNSLASIDDLGNLVVPNITVDELTTDSIVSETGNGLCVDNVAKFKKSGNNSLILVGEECNPNCNNIYETYSCKRDIDVWLEADTDGATPNDSPIIAMSRDANRQASLLCQANGSSNFWIKTGSSDGSTQDICLKTGGVYAPTSSLPNFSAITGLKVLGNNQKVEIPISLKVDTIEDIGGAGVTVSDQLLLTTGQITSAPVVGDDIVNKTYADSLGGNPFDQDLNTTDAVQFLSVATDTINELTPAAGVTIDGLLIRDGVLDLPGGFPNFFKIAGVPYGGNQSFFTTSPMTFQSVRLDNEVFTDTIEESTLNSGVTFNHEIYLPTGGGTADPLDYYEDTFTTTDTWTGGAGWSQSVKIDFARIGKMVFCYIVGAEDSQGSPSIISSPVGIIPTRYLPQSVMKFPIVAYDGGAANEWCEIQVYDATTATESFRIGESDDSQGAPPFDFTAGTVGFKDITLTWITA